MGESANDHDGSRAGLRTATRRDSGARSILPDGVIPDAPAIRNDARLIQQNAEELTSMVENVLAFYATLHHAVGERAALVAVGDLLSDAAAA